MVIRNTVRSPKKSFCLAERNFQIFLSGFFQKLFTFVSNKTEHQSAPLILFHWREFKTLRFYSTLKQVASYTYSRLDNKLMMVRLTKSIISYIVQQVKRYLLIIRYTRQVFTSEYFILVSRYRYYCQNIGTYLPRWLTLGIVMQSLPGFPS